MRNDAQAFKGCLFADPNCVHSLYISICLKNLCKFKPKSPIYLFKKCVYKYTTNHGMHRVHNWGINMVAALCAEFKINPI